MKLFGVSVEEFIHSLIRQFCSPHSKKNRFLPLIYLTKSHSKPMYRQLRSPLRSVWTWAICKIHLHSNTLPQMSGIIPFDFEISEPLAQLVERLTFNQDVDSSNLSGLTIFSSKFSNRLQIGMLIVHLQL